MTAFSWGLFFGVFLLNLCNYGLYILAPFTLRDPTQCGAGMGVRRCFKEARGILDGSIILEVVRGFLEEASGKGVRR